MKKSFLFAGISLLGFEATLGSQVAPGVFKMNSPTSGDTGAIVVLNHIPNENNDNYGGWNFFFVRDVSLTPTLHTSRKANPLYNASNTGATMSAQIPCNFATAEEAVAAYTAGTNIVAV